MFEGFVLEHIDVGDLRPCVRHGGEGPAVLVHGHPRTHPTWHRVERLLVEGGHSVVCPDLRGYGRSTPLPDRPGHSQRSKREMEGPRWCPPG